MNLSKEPGRFGGPGVQRRRDPGLREWRRLKYHGFDIARASTAKGTIQFPLGGREVTAYANANLSIYSGQACNAKCPFCVEELRPACRGVKLALQKTVERDDGVYFSALEEVLRALRPLNPSVSITGGEPSLDPRLPRILRTVAEHGMRKRTITTNGSGLLELREGRTVIDWLVSTGIRHLNISRAHPATKENARLMKLDRSMSVEDLRSVARLSSAAGTRVRLSCVLLKGGIDCLEGMFDYLDFAERAGVDNVVFRQLMLPGRLAPLPDPVALFSNENRVRLDPILDEIAEDGRFAFKKTVIGYYYYVEVWTYRGIDVVLEEADLGQIEIAKRAMPGIIQELIFHP
ncbi:MAG TPA: radical SAM protein, partial [Thermodesulfobacteriota bacterium]|nr:radical SAM protein [Thermodesulfobacteriota bacterium]